MAIVVTPLNRSLPLAEYSYNVTGLVNGVNNIVLPLAPQQGSFPPLADWTPTFVYCFPYQAGAVGATVTPDLQSIVNTTGNIIFNLYTTGNTNCFIIVA